MEKGVLTRVLAVIAIFAFIFFIITVYIVYGRGKSCGSFECFQEKMQGCRKAVFVNDANEAMWKYTIKGLSGDKCQIDVKLLQAKLGSLRIDELEGFEMSCFYDSGVFAYPEKDLEMCHGRLKEELQSIAIQKLHQYIIENLGQVDEALNSIV